MKKINIPIILLLVASFLLASCADSGSGGSGPAPAGAIAWRDKEKATTSLGTGPDSPGSTGPYVWRESCYPIERNYIYADGNILAEWAGENEFDPGMSDLDNLRINYISDLKLINFKNEKIGAVINARLAEMNDNIKQRVLEDIDWENRLISEIFISHVSDCAGGLLSVHMSYSYFGYNHYKEDHVETAVFDMATGKELNLSDLFVPGVNYIDYINFALSSKIISSSNPWFDYAEEYLIAPFTGIPNDYPLFTVWGNALTIFFPKSSPYFLEAAQFTINLPSEILSYERQTDMTDFFYSPPSHYRVLIIEDNPAFTIANEEYLPVTATAVDDRFVIERIHFEDDDPEYESLIQSAIRKLEDELFKVEYLLPALNHAIGDKQFLKVFIRPSPSYDNGGVAQNLGGYYNYEYSVSVEMPDSYGGSYSYVVFYIPVTIDRETGEPLADPTKHLKSGFTVEDAISRYVDAEYILPIIDQNLRNGIPVVYGIYPYGGMHIMTYIDDDGGPRCFETVTDSGYFDWDSMIPSESE